MFLRFHGSCRLAAQSPQRQSGQPGEQADSNQAAGAGKDEGQLKADVIGDIAAHQRPNNGAGEDSRLVKRDGSGATLVGRQLQQQALLSPTCHGAV